MLRLAALTLKADRVFNRVGVPATGLPLQPPAPAAGHTCGKRGATLVFTSPGRKALCPCPCHHPELQDYSGLPHPSSDHPQLGLCRTGLTWPVFPELGSVREVPCHLSMPQGAGSLHQGASFFSRASNSITKGLGVGAPTSLPRPSPRDLLLELHFATHPQCRPPGFFSML